MQHKAVGADALLAGNVKAGEETRLKRLVEVGVVQDDEDVVAAHLSVNFFRCLAAWVAMTAPALSEPVMAAPTMRSSAMMSETWAEEMNRLAQLPGPPRSAVLRRGHRALYSHRIDKRLQISHALPCLTQRPSAGETEGLHAPADGDITFRVRSAS